MRSRACRWRGGTVRRFVTGLLVLVSAVALVLASTSLWTRPQRGEHAGLRDQRRDHGRPARGGGAHHRARHVHGDGQRGRAAGHRRRAHRPAAPPADVAIDRGGGHRFARVSRRAPAARRRPVPAADVERAHLRARPTVLIWIAALVALYLGALEWLRSRAPEPTPAEQTASGAVPSAGPDGVAGSGAAVVPGVVPAPVQVPSGSTARPRACRAALRSRPRWSRSRLRPLRPGGAQTRDDLHPRRPPGPARAPGGRPGRRRPHRRGVLGRKENRLLAI